MRLVMLSLYILMDVSSVLLVNLGIKLYFGDDSTEADHEIWCPVLCGAIVELPRYMLQAAGYMSFEKSLA